MLKNFNNAQVLLNSWYVVGRSAALRAGQVVSRDVGGHRLAVFRGRSGQVHALLSRCAHLGADLAYGNVVDDTLRCPFHQWTYGGDGRCVRIPSQDNIPAFARTAAWTVQERYGAIWVWPGAEPAFPIPAFEKTLVPCALRPQVLSCHPNVVTCNGLDVEHFRTVHRLTFAETPRLEEPDPWQLVLHLPIRPTGILRALAGPLIEATFSTWAGNLATIHAEIGRFPLRVLFTHRPLASGQSASQTFFFVPHLLAPLVLALAWGVMGPILQGDRHILDHLRFQPHLVDADGPLARFIQKVERIPTYA